MATATMKHHGRASTTETLTANGAGATATRFITGPARDATLFDGKVQGRYILETGTTFRWVEDFRVNMAATLSAAFTNDNI